MKNCVYSSTDFLGAKAPLGSIDVKVKVKAKKVKKLHYFALIAR